MSKRDEVYVAEIEAVESFCQKMRAQTKRRHYAGIGADARSALGRLLNLIEYASIDQHLSDHCQGSSPCLRGSA